MTLYGNVRRKELSRGLDRNTWASLTQVVFEQETEGSGTLVTDPLLFGTVFEGPPTLSYGVELQEGQTLVDRDYPFVSAGVASYIQKEDNFTLISRVFSEK